MDDAAQSGEYDLFFGESAEFSPEARTAVPDECRGLERSPSTTHFQLLEESGIKLAAPESMDAERLAALTLSN
jgi:hypothetical protein